MGISSYSLPFTRKEGLTTIGHKWLASNHWLTPSDWKIRTIVDQGSIKSSIEQAPNFDLFDRVRNPDSPNKLLSGIARALMVVGINTLGLPLDCVWHAGHCFYQRFLNPKGIENRDFFFYHLTSFAKSLAQIALTCAVAHDILKSNKTIWRSSLFVEGKLSFAAIAKLVVLTPGYFRLVTNIVHISLVVLTPIALEIYFASPFTSTDDHIKPFIMKQALGIVGKDGSLLTFDEKVDAEHLEEDDGNGKSEKQQKFLFIDLYCDRIRIIRAAVKKALQLNLTITFDDMEDIIDSPSGINNFLKKFPKEYLESNEGFKLADNLTRSLPELKVLEEILPDIIPSEFTDDFLKEELFAQFVPENDFSRSLAEFKRPKPDLGGPNEEYISIKSKILKATTAYEVLGLQEGASKDECRKKFKQMIVFVSPDKVSDEWKEEAAMLFKIVKNASDLPL